MFFIIGPFHIYQFVLIVLAIIFIGFYYHRLRSKKATSASFILWLIIWIIILLFAFKPEISAPLANIAGFGRGIDLLLIIGLFISLYLGFSLYMKFDDMNQQINELVRELAIRDEIELDEDE